jgi:adenylyltransferase/sulfurtransferase
MTISLTSGAGLSEAERLRYSRQIIVPGIGLEGQARLKHASALVVGIGGLGSPAALYLAAAGIGRLGIADPDSVEASNLQRQILHFTSDIGTAKVESAGRKLADVNPFLKIDILRDDVKAANAWKYDIEFVP